MYATESPAKGGSSATPWIVGAAAIGAGYAGYTYLGNKSASASTPASKDQKKDEGQKAPTAPKDAPKAFTGGDQGFLDLKLSAVEPYNHNTKKFRFDLPEKDQVSGLHIACERSS